MTDPPTPEPQPTTPAEVAPAAAVGGEAAAVGNDRSGAEDGSAGVRRVDYKGEPLDADRGPGLGCFRFQLVVLAIFIVLTPLSVAWHWPEWISTVLLISVIVLLLVAGQTIIFLLRLVAADRRGRRRPLGSATRTVGELEDERTGEPAEPQDGRTAATTDDRPNEPPSDEGPVRQ